MKIAILHHDIEPPEIKFLDFFKKKKILTDLFDVREVSGKELLQYDLVFNRVYSSVASRDFEVLEKTLNLLKFLEKKRINCINSYSASLADYSKFELFKALSSKGVKTPPTIFVGSKKEIPKASKKAIKEFGFPIVVKRNCGGKSYEVNRVHSAEELDMTIKKMFDVAENEGYKAGFILQKFIQSVREHDCRVAVLNGKFIFSYGRSYISRNSKDKWISSTSGGSYEFDYLASESEIELAIQANLAIGAKFSESDVILTKDGPYIIEVNPTPGYFIDSIDDLNRMEIIVDNLLSTSLTNKFNLVREVIR